MGSAVLLGAGEGADLSRAPSLGCYVSLIPAGLPEIPLGIGDDRLTQAPRLIGRRIDDGPAVPGGQLHGLVDIVDEDEDHRPQRGARDPLDSGMETGGRWSGADA